MGLVQNFVAARYPQTHVSNFVRCCLHLIGHIFVCKLSGRLTFLFFLFFSF